MNNREKRTGIESRLQAMAARITKNKERQKDIMQAARVAIWQEGVQDENEGLKYIVAKSAMHREIRKLNGQKLCIPEYVHQIIAQMPKSSNPNISKKENDRVIDKMLSAYNVKNEKTRKQIKNKINQIIDQDVIDREEIDSEFVKMPQTPDDVKDLIFKLRIEGWTEEEKKAAKRLIQGQTDIQIKEELGFKTREFEHIKNKIKHRLERGI